MGLCCHRKSTSPLAGMFVCARTSSGRPIKVPAPMSDDAKNMRRDAAAASRAAAISDNAEYSATASSSLKEGEARNGSNDADRGDLYRTCCRDWKESPSFHRKKMTQHENTNLRRAIFMIKTDRKVRNSSLYKSLW
mmetsp:Transcript_5072/g.12102  ORF Transcript_5072/g.12102 Transcript_5072/m.12102 type:complete len:136 (-) Transcript_5072:57-464(-)